MNKQLFSITEAAKLLGVAEHKISYAHRCGKLPEPRFRLSNRRAYSIEELETMADYFGVRLEERRLNTKGDNHGD